MTNPSKAVIAVMDYRNAVNQASLTSLRNIIGQHPVALELRRMQMVAEVGAEHNITTVILIPSDFVNLAKNMSDMMSANIKKQEDKGKEA